MHALFSSSLPLFLNFQPIFHSTVHISLLPISFCYSTLENNLSLLWVFFLRSFLCFLCVLSSPLLVLLSPFHVICSLSLGSLSVQEIMLYLQFECRGNFSLIVHSLFSLKDLYLFPPFFFIAWEIKVGIECIS